jgi:3-methyladenine DNA glycosylase AlkD
MMLQKIMDELRSKGNEGTKKVLLKHGIKEPFFGVKIEDLKVIQKRIKKDYQLSKDLYATGNADAMYLAGLIADENKMTKADLNTWVRRAVSTNISVYTVSWIAAESRFGYELAIDWINAKEEYIVAAGWSALSSIVAIKQDNELDVPALKKLLDRVANNINKADNRVRSTMNGFVIAVGCYVVSLTDYAINIAKQISNVKVNMGDTACKLPNPLDYIAKLKAKGTLGKKKKMARC